MGVLSPLRANTPRWRANLLVGLGSGTPRRNERRRWLTAVLFMGVNPPVLAASMFRRVSGRQGRWSCPIGGGLYERTTLSCSNDALRSGGSG